MEPAHVILGTLAISLVLFVTDAVRYDLIAIGVAVVLAGSGVLTPEQAFGGFSSPAVMLVLSMYVFAQAFTRSGLAEQIGRKVLGAGSPGEAALVFRVVLVSGLMSAFLANTGVVAILIPVLSALGRRFEMPASRLMMPLAAGSLAGGLVTVIGSSKNIAVNGVIQSYGARPFELFEFTLFGLAIVGTTSLYFLGPGRYFLPRKRVDETLSEHYQVRKFLTEVLVEPSSTLINRAVADTDFFGAYGITLLGIVRTDASSVLAPGPYNRIRQEDKLIVQGEPEAILRMRRDLGLRKVESAAVGDERIRSSDVQLVEAVLPAGSTWVGRTLIDSDFPSVTDLNVLGVSKHGELQVGPIEHALLEVGDTLLLQGHGRDIDRARKSGELLILDEVDPTGADQRGRITLAVMLGLALIVSFDLLPLSVAALAGAMVLVFSGCVPAKDMYRIVDWQAVVLIGGMLGLGRAFKESGLDRELAHFVSGLTSGSTSPYLIVGVLLTATMILTQLTTHLAAAVVMAPIALGLAHELGVGDRAFLMAVVTGASLAFMSPVAHQANAMVMGPGDYRYRDFVKVGFGLTLVLSVVAVALIPVLWPVGPPQ